jgi:multidrug efflux pump
VTKSTSNFLLVVGLTSVDGSLDRNALTDYLVSNVQDIVSRLEGVGEMQTFGSQNAMRIWLDPGQHEKLSADHQEVIAALQAQNAQVSAGQFGETPVRQRAAAERHHHHPHTDATPEQFDAIILKTHPDGSTVRLKDVAECQIGTESYDTQSYYKGKPVGAMAIRFASGANALETATRIKDEDGGTLRYFPQAWRWSIRSTPRPSSRSPSRKWSKP